MTKPVNIVIADVEKFLAAFKNPQTAVTALAGLISALGAFGILQAPLVGWLQGVLAAIAALIVALLAKPVTAALVKRAARKAGPAPAPPTTLAA
jgi:multisubunit Na+/H+ antiporter MnhG subunit